MVCTECYTVVTAVHCKVVCYDVRVQAQQTIYQQKVRPALTDGAMFVLCCAFRLGSSVHSTLTAQQNTYYTDSQHTLSSHSRDEAKCSLLVQKPRVQMRPEWMAVC